ncbi:stalk domain-containing protein [Sporosarcina sp. 179-K 3D1 HS]|uniref:stalk domain-containing protein n=1 Tax=Sporosarcina sp. 179-K 3D1 HS TaxID=3232169 RepID=UPI0039A02B1A
MKKMGTIAMAALLTGSLMGGYSAMAQEELVQAVQEQQEDTTNYIQYAGVITDIEKDGSEIRATVENEEGMITIFRVHDDSLVFNSGTTKPLTKAELAVGDAVEGYYDKNKPMILIYPATVTPEILIVKDEKIFGEVKIGKFDKDLLSLDGELKLNIGEKTELVNQKRNAIKEEDLHGKNLELVVFYDATTRSIPPQTTPNKIMTLNYVTDEMSKVEELIANDHYMKNGVKMIPLRKVAEQLGYHVQSLPKENGALVTKQNLSFKIIRGEKTYGFNRSIAKFKQAPELKGMKTYVSEDFLEQLLQN